MGFFSGLRQDLSQAVNDLMSNESTRDSVTEYREPKKEKTESTTDGWSGFLDEDGEESFIGQGSYFDTVLEEAEPELTAQGTASEGVFLDELLPEESELDEMLIGEPASGATEFIEPMAEEAPAEPEPGKPMAEEIRQEEPAAVEMMHGGPITEEIRPAEPTSAEPEPGEATEEEVRREPATVEMMHGEPIAEEEVRQEEPAAAEVRHIGPITEEIQPEGPITEAEPAEETAAEDAAPETPESEETVQAEETPGDLAGREFVSEEAIPETDPEKQDNDNIETFHISQVKEEETGNMNMETFGFEGENFAEETAIPEEPAVVENVETEAAAQVQEARRVPVDETAVITAGMTINGDIASAGSMEVTGTIIGNIDILGKLNVTGAIQGNSKAAEVYCEGAKITGEIVSEGSVKVGQSTVIIGNIAASSAVIAGAVKGDIDVHGPVVLDTTAIVMGNIKFKSVQINNGAVIEGMCSQCYSDVNPSSFFEDFTAKMKSDNNEQ